MKLVFVIVAFVVCTALATPTDTSVINEAFGNTIVFTYADGLTTELWLSPDGRFLVQSQHNHHYHGRWKLSGLQLCLKGSGIESLVPAKCYQIPPPPLGLRDPAWTQQMPVGGSAQVKLVDGHFVPPAS